MSFQYSAIGDNTPENREHLEKLGYKVVASNDECGDTLFTFESGIADAEYASEITIIYSEDTNDCRSNSALFQAVTALRKDTGIHQFYTDGNRWQESDIHDLLEIPDYLTELEFNVEKTHKATLTELQEHFK